MVFRICGAYTRYATPFTHGKINSFVGTQSPAAKFGFAKFLQMRDFFKPRDQIVFKHSVSPQICNVYSQHHTKLAAARISRQSERTDNSNQEKHNHNGKFYMLTVAALTAWFWGTTDSKNDSDDEKTKRIKILLALKPYERTVSEKIELYSLLLEKSEEEIKKAKGKNVVIVFGETAAGKSSVVNALAGCSMTLNDQGQLVVDRRSKIKEITPIGHSPIESCTYLPVVTPDLTIESDETNDNRRPSRKMEVVTICDFPGQTDTHGIEVVLVNAIAMKRLVEHAKSARFLLVFDSERIQGGRGGNLTRELKLLSERFNNRLGKKPNSLLAIFTRTNNIQDVKRKIQEHTPTDSINLTPYATIFNPLKAGDRTRVLNEIFKTEAHRATNINVSLSHEQYWQALALGKEVSQVIIKELTDEKIQEALGKTRFTWGLAKLDNPNLADVHKIVENAILDYMAKEFRAEVGKKGAPFENQLDAFKKWVNLRELFSPMINFDRATRDMRVAVSNVTDPRWFYQKPGYFPTFALSTVGMMAATAALIYSGAGIPIVFATGSGTVASAGATCTSGKPKFSPSEREKYISKMFDEL
jgi:hypothetical protein